MTNPQVGAGFNRDYWARFEKFVKDTAKKSDGVYVVTGPLYLPTPEADPATGRPGWRMQYPMIGGGWPGGGSLVVWGWLGMGVVGIGWGWGWLGSRMQYPMIGGGWWLGVGRGWLGLGFWRGRSLVGWEWLGWKWGWGNGGGRGVRGWGGSLAGRG